MDEQIMSWATSRPEVSQVDEFGVFLLSAFCSFCSEFFCQVGGILVYLNYF